MLWRREFGVVMTACLLLVLSLVFFGWGVREMRLANSVGDSLMAAAIGVTGLLALVVGDVLVLFLAYRLLPSPDNAHTRPEWDEENPPLEDSTTASTSEKRHQE